MKAYVNRIDAFAASVFGQRRPRYWRRTVLWLERMIRRTVAHMPSRRRALRRWLPLRH